MIRTIATCALSLFLAWSALGTVRAATLEGVITSYVSGNEGTDMTVRTSDGHTHRLWFDNLKKPRFEGAQLPWCPSFPCSGWPRQLVLNRTRVLVYTVTQRVSGTTVETPTKIVLAP